MSKFEDRVLARAGARELTMQETGQVSAAMAFNTLVCTALVKTSTHTGLGDGDGCSDTDNDSSFI
jgi:hypothetical protein